MFSFKKKEKKPTILAIHGFGKRRSDQFQPLKDYFIPLGYEVLTPNLFNSEDETDIDANQWMKRASEATETLVGQGKDIILVGFSMGGVIASSLAAHYKVKKLILLSPAFNYLTFSNITSTVSSIFESNQETITKTPEGYTPLPSTFTNAFRTIVDEHKDEISLVSCPILIFHGMEDETIPYSSSRKILKKISHQHRALILLSDADHHLLDNELNRNIVLCTMQSFIENKL